METQISRDGYLDKLILCKHNGLLKIVTGIRRCGKSFLLRILFKQHLPDNGTDRDHIIKMAFDLNINNAVYGE